MPRLLVLTVLFAALVGSAPAQETEADQSTLDLRHYTCANHTEIADAEDGRAEIVLLWAHGYWSALHGVGETSDAITAAMVEEFRDRLMKACESNPAQLFIVAVKNLKEGETDR